MKIIDCVLPFLASLGLVSAAFKGTNEEFMQVIEAGGVPKGLAWVNEDVDDSNLRSERDLQELGKIGDSCGNRRPCEDGLDCVRGAGLGRVCSPNLDCIYSVIDEFREENGLQNYGEEIMQKSGWSGLEITNRTGVNNGLLNSIANAPEYVIRKDARDAIVNAMLEDPPDMLQLALNVNKKCPRAASAGGVTLMLGFHYEISLLLPKFYNSYYFAIGTADVNVGGSQEGGPLNDEVAIEYNVTAAVLTDLCGGVGPDIGLSFGGVAGAALTGKKDDVIGCSFLFDCDIALATGVGLAVGVTSEECVTKFMFDIGAGLGAGIGFQGCNTIEITELFFEGEESTGIAFPPIPPFGSAPDDAFPPNFAPPTTAAPSTAAPSTAPTSAPSTAPTSAPSTAAPTTA